MFVTIFFNDFLLGSHCFSETDWLASPRDSPDFVFQAGIRSMYQCTQLSMVHMGAREINSSSHVWTGSTFLT